MVNWLTTMQQTFEYYIVDPDTWRDTKKIDVITDSTISWDLNAETLGSATITVAEPLGECYIRIYLITVQNEIREKHPLGTFLIQTPSYNFDGKSTSIAMDAYTPLLELKEKLPALGYYVLKGENILNVACDLIAENARAPVVKTEKEDILRVNFIANVDDTWLTFLSDLLANANQFLSLDEMGRILLPPKQDTSSLQPVWTYDDTNSSILYPKLDIDRDLYNIPNVVEVIYSNSNECYVGRAINNDPASPTSIPNRGREIIHRISDPDLLGNPSEGEIQRYAEKTLRELSALEYTISYTHGYCPVRIGDCIRLNYKKAGVYGITAKVIKQSIDCVPGCPVTETAVFAIELWG